MCLRSFVLAVAAFLVGAGALPTSAHAAPEVRRYALAVMHFNVQYVAGGTIAFVPGMKLDRTNDETEDSIIVESFEPILDMLLRHPAWGMDLEMQAYMLDVMGQRHPKVLEKLRTLAKRGQVEVPSFHYSDQLFLAYPPVDWERSADLVAETFARLDVPRGTSVFCQEGQAGEGMAAAMKARGYKTLVWPKNLFSFQHGDATPPPPLYRFGEVLMIQSRGTHFTDDKIDLDTQFTFVDDGELLATGGLNPYFPDLFKHDPAAVAEYEQGLLRMEMAGYRITTVAQYIADIEPLVTPAAPPPLLDGTWQPKSTGGIHKWLGGLGIWMDERDNDVRSLGAAAHRELVAAEAIAKAKSKPANAASRIAEAYRLLALGQVTDATGINPYRGEVEYGLAHFAEVLRIARDIIDEAKDAAGDTVHIDPAAGTVDATPFTDELATATAPSSLASMKVVSGDRSAAVTWQKRGDGVYRVRVDFGEGEARALSITFPGDNGDLVYTPGLMSAPVHHPRAAFLFSDFELALSDGLIGLGHGLLVKDQAYSHLSARVTLGSGDVRFSDETTPIGEPSTWVFYYVPTGGDPVKAEQAAVALARSINVTRAVWR